MHYKTIFIPVKNSLAPYSHYLCFSWADIKIDMYSLKPCPKLREAVGAGVGLPPTTEVGYILVLLVVLKGCIALAG